MFADVQSIVGILQANDPNVYPSEGILDRINALATEFDNGSPSQGTHNKNIEKILYAIAGIDDQYKIHHYNPATQATPPTQGSHVGRVVQLFMNIDDICRDIYGLLDPGTPLNARPVPVNYDTQDIVNLANDTEMVVDKIEYYVQHYHPIPTAMTSK
jgi:hypothetical protein